MIARADEPQHHAGPPLARFAKRELFGTKDNMADVKWEEHIRARAATIYHPACTGKMGVDDGAVVDPQLRLPS
jgi:choline dehydrogenase-like flavoprotein